MQTNSHPLRQFRKRLGISLEALARDAGTTKVSLSRIENRLQVPSLELVGRLKEATGGAVTADDFLSIRVVDPAPSTTEASAA